MQLLELERAGPGGGERLRARRQMLLTVTEPRYCQGPRACVPRLSTRAIASIGFSSTSTTSVEALGLFGEGFSVVVNFRPGQVVREQQIALQRADVGRPVGDDPRGVVGEEVAVARQLLPGHTTRSI